MRDIVSQVDSLITWRTSFVPKEASTLPSSSRTAFIRWGVTRVPPFATEEIAVGDNDTLAAMVAESAEADLLVLLSDIDGLYTADPHKDPTATVIQSVHALTPDILALGGDKGSDLGTGGMKTKLHAASLCMEAGCDMIIANGTAPHLLYDILDGKPVGTRFYGKE